MVDDLPPVTLEDIAAARYEWERAKARGDDRRLVADLWWDVEALCVAYRRQTLAAQAASTATAPAH